LFLWKASRYGTLEHQDYIKFHYYCYYNRKLTANQNKYTNQVYTQCNKVITPFLASSNKELTKELNYTISPFTHVPFPQHIICDSATCTNSTEYSKIIKIGENTLTVTYSTNGKILPSGIYPRRLFSYLCSQIVITKSKTPIIELPSSKAKFIKKILKINYICGKKENLIIKAQLQAFCECLVSIQYSNPNDAARKPKELIKFIEGDCSFLYDDSQKWQREISLSSEMLELIKHSSVPISAKANTEFTNSRKLDIFNYFTYQNYNLHLKKLDHNFEICDLYNQFGGGLSNLNAFKRIFNKILIDLKEVSCLNIVPKNKRFYTLLSNEDSLLQRQDRRKTNVIKNEKLVISEDYKTKLEDNYTRLEIESATIYVAKRIARGGAQIRNQYAYLKDVLKNPSFYYKEKQTFIKNTHKIQFAEYERLSHSEREKAANLLKILIKNTPNWGVPSELQPALEQLKTPGRVIIKDTPRFAYICYLFWAFNFDKCIEVCDGSSELIFIKLFKHLR
jgi:hypothetical protein